MKKIGIHQPNLMPWLGYFYKIMQSDVFVILDDVQFQKTGSSYTNRVSILQKGVSQYITVPIKRKEGVWKINESEFSHPKWRNKVKGSLQACYGKAPFFKENKEFIFDLIDFEATYISDFNANFIIKISERIGFQGKFKFSSDLQINTVSTERLIEIIKYFEGNVYLSGKGGANYQDEDLYEMAKISLKYLEFYNEAYPQVFNDGFEAGQSIVDAIFNIGFDGVKNLLKK